MAKAIKSLSDEKKLQLVKQTAKLSAKEAAAKLNISIQSLYKWRKLADKNAKATEGETPVATTTEVKVSVVKKPSMKKLIKAVDSIQANLQTIQSFLQSVEAA